MTKLKQLGQQLEIGKLRTYLANFGWLLLERGISLLLSVVVAVWLARYLQPDDFGRYSYAISFVGLFGFLSYLGLDGIVTRDLVKQPAEHARLMGTVFVMRLGGSVTAVLLILATVFLLVDASTTRWLVAIVALGLFFDPFAVVDFWFQSRVENQYSAMARAGTAVLSSLVYASLILLKAPLTAFAVAVVAEQGVRAAAFVLVYRRQGNRLAAWQFNGPMARTLLRQSWPLIISSAGSLIYLKVDQIMLGNMVGTAEVGIYSVAVRLSEVWYIIPALAATSLFPAIVRSKAQSPALYQQRLQRAYTTMAWAGIAIAIVISLAANWLIALLYGDAYQAAGRILAVHIWTCPIMFMGPILSKWLIVEDLFIFSLTRHGLGAVLNVVLNLFLIPAYGGFGAAIATLVSYSVAVYFACFTDTRTRIAGKMMTRALLRPFLNAVKQ